MAYVRKKQNTKQEIAYRKIKNAILVNELPPDMMLVEDKLCEMLGFSKTPIREALRRLTSEGFVESIPETGTFVSNLSIEELIELFDVREMLEGLAARLCAIRLEKDVINQLKNIIIELEEDLINNKRSASVKLDMKFHDVVIKGSHSERLMKFTRTMIQQIYRFASLSADEPERLIASLEEHKKIYMEISKGDAENAEKYMREHIRSVKAFQIRKNLLINN